mgnify:CR=1 FL=1
MTTTRQKADADAKTIGVEIVDVRLRRVELPPDVTGPVYARMESERRRVANELRSLGQAESEKIRADADRQRVVILADAYKAVAEDQGRRRREGLGDLRRRRTAPTPSSTRSTAASRRTRRRSAARAT